MLNRIWIDEQYWHGYFVKDAEFLNLRKLNFFIGVNNSGKSRFVRQVFVEKTDKLYLSTKRCDLDRYKEDIKLLNDFCNADVGFKNCLPDMLLEILKRQVLSLDEWSYLNDFGLKLPELLQDHMITLCDIDNYSGFEASLDFERDYKRKMFTGIEMSTFPTRYYIPVLRGLRPVDPNQDSYHARTLQDYFNDDGEIKIVTGHELYDLLVEYLLGLPENRAKVRAYERKLGDVFFEGKDIVLIPEYGKDTVAVKIGDESQFPIYNLGDGLQQVIIITSHAFLNDKVAMYCVEEPEVHMHPGLLRRLAVFLAEETPHQYLMTSHSNHLLDLADDRDDVAIHKVQKQLAEEKTTFRISEVSRDKGLLLELGVRPSSVYLANCTIWIEGITDRMYIRAFLNRYLIWLKTRDSDLFKMYSSYNENYHFAFVEYQGGVLSHWNFNDDKSESEEFAKLSAASICAESLVIADGDIKSKGNREKCLKQQLGERLIVLHAKEIENYLPANIIQQTVQIQFELKRANKAKVDIEQIGNLKTQSYCGDLNNGIGSVIDRTLLVNESESLFAAQSGTIKEKVKFCKIACQIMSKNDWDIPDYLKSFCETIFEHITRFNEGRA